MANLFWPLYFQRFINAMFLNIEENMSTNAPYWHLRLLWLKSYEVLFSLLLDIGLVVFERYWLSSNVFIDYLSHRITKQFTTQLRTLYWFPALPLHG